MEPAVTVTSEDQPRRRRVVRRTQAAQKTAIGDADEPAKMKFENFETLIGFKSRLNLLEGDPDKTPEMRGKSGDYLPLGTDKEEPTTREIQRKAPDYENAPGLTQMEFPHDREHVNQRTAAGERSDVLAELEQRRQRFLLARRAVVAEDDRESIKDTNRGSGATDMPEPTENTGRETSEDTDIDYSGSHTTKENPPEVRTSATDEDARLRVALKIAEIRVKAGFLNEDAKVDYAYEKTGQLTLSQLEDKLEEHQEWTRKVAVAPPHQPVDQQFTPPRITAGIPRSRNDIEVAPEDAVFGG